MVDPIEELAGVAVAHRIGFHTDACLGGFVLPFAEKLGYPVPRFDFRVPGVTSISCDTHKFGYAAKGTSVLLWRTEELRDHQFYVTSDRQPTRWCATAPTARSSRRRTSSSPRRMTHGSR